MINYPSNTSSGEKNPTSTYPAFQSKPDNEHMGSFCDYNSASFWESIWKRSFGTIVVSKPCLPPRQRATLLPIPLQYDVYRWWRKKGSIGLRYCGYMSRRKSEKVKFNDEKSWTTPHMYLDIRSRGGLTTPGKDLDEFVANAFAIFDIGSD